MGVFNDNRFQSFYFDSVLLMTKKKFCRRHIWLPKHYKEMKAKTQDANKGKARKRHNQKH